jgi:hypothetical protein
MKRLFSVAVASLVLATATAHAGQRKTETVTPEQACQAQALGAIARNWSNVMKGQFQIIVRDRRCLVILQAPAIYEGKRTACLIDGKTGEMLSEFYASVGPNGWQDNDRGLCTFAGGKFKTSECTWSEYLDKADQM